jgi:hypothetical protein
VSQTTENLCGPNELVAHLMEHRLGTRQRQPVLYGNISDEGLSHLVHLSYYASQVVEEGRYSKFRLYVPPVRDFPLAWQDPWSLARFSEPVVLRAVDDLRRLAPCAASHDLALEVCEVGEVNGQARVECCGIRMAHSGEGSTEVCSTAIWARHVDPGLMIRVDGPGELRASEGNCVWDLRAGNLVQLGSVPTHPLPLWLDRLSARLAANKEHHDKYINRTMHFAWNEVIHLASEMRRGGCLIVLPKVGLDAAKVEAEYAIQLKYPTNGVGLGRAVADFVKSCLASAGIADKDQFKETAGRWLQARHMLLSIVESVARLTAVDGCTVFDEDLQLIGFGGKIHSFGPESKNLLDARANKFLSKEVMEKTGTRHHSAYRLCQAHEGVSCYIVSQDGQVTAMWGLKDTVHRWTPYWPWAKRSDHY